MRRSHDTGTKINGLGVLETTLMTNLVGEPDLRSKGSE